MKNKDIFIELHIHLDGSLSINTIKKLAKMQNIQIDNDENLEKTISVGKNCKDLNEYLEKFDFPLSLLQTEDAIKEAVFCLCEELKQQNVIYAEIRFAPQLHLKKGLSQQDVVKSAIEGLKKSSLDANLILCCMRSNNNKNANFETIEVARKHLNNGVCAIDLAGAEALFPTENFKDLFLYAKEKNVPFTIHAGEADGPKSIYDAVSFGAKRIGHGVRCIEDENLMKLLCDKGITLELCPTSNLNTKIFNSIKDYPIKKFIQKGIKFTINTDNTTVSNTNIKNEVEIIKNTFAISESDIKNLILNAINASFADEKTKEKIKKIIQSNTKKADF